MWAAMDELHRSDQTLEENVQTLKERHHEYFQVEYEILNPYPLSDMI